MLISSSHSFRLVRGDDARKRFINNATGGWSLTTSTWRIKERLQLLDLPVHLIQQNIWLIKSARTPVDVLEGIQVIDAAHMTVNLILEREERSNV